MKLAELRDRRLHALHIARPALTEPAEVVARLGALQAQDYPGTLWAIGLRTQGAGIADVQRAIAERKIVRTWPLRGTLHCVAASDVHWLFDLLAPRVLKKFERRHRELNLDAKQFRAAERVLLRVLEGGAQRTRQELTECFRRSKLALEGPRLYHCLWYLAQHKLLCFGAPRGKQPTFTLLTDWVPAAASPLSREAALAGLALRYFSGHGPASLADLARWAGIGLGEAKLGLASVEKQLDRATVDGVPHYFAGEDSPPSAAVRDAFLLPGFDEYMLGYKDRAGFLDPQHADKIVPGGNGIFRPTLVLRGRVLGTWRAAERKRELSIELEPFAPLSAADRRLLSRAAERYGAFAGKLAQLA